MQNKYEIQIEASGGESSTYELNDILYFEYANNALTQVEQKSSIEIKLSEGAVAFKYNNISDNLLLNNDKLKPDALYFLDKTDIIKIGDIKLSLSITDQLSTNENLKANDGKTKLLSLDDIAKATNTTNEPDQTQQQAPSLQARGTTTSIDISELLKKEGLVDETSQKKKANNKKKVAKVKKINLDQTQIRKRRVKTIKDEEKKKKEKLFGVFSRLFATLSDFVISFLLIQKVTHPLISKLVNSIKLFINSKISEYELTVSEEFIKFILIFITIRTLSNIIFGVGLSTFFMGGTTAGGFGTKRLKALIRTPLELLTIILPIIDITLVFGKTTLKEVITRGAINYRFKSFKYLSFPIFSIVLITGLAYKPITEIIKARGLSEYQEVSPLKNEYSQSVLVLADNYKLDYHIDGSSKHGHFFIMVNKYDGKVIFIKKVFHHSYEKLKNLIKRVPLYKEVFPFASSYDRSKPVTDKHKKEFMNFLFLNRYIKGLQFKKFMGLNLLAANYAPKDVLLERSKKVSDVGNDVFLIDGKTYYFASDKEIVAMNVIPPKKINALYNDITVNTYKNSNPLPLEELLANKSIDGVKILNYLEHLDLMIKSIKLSKSNRDKNFMKEFLRQILAAVQDKNDIQYLSLKNSINSMIKNL